MELSPSREAANCAATQEFTNIKKNSIINKKRKRNGN
jgi:hypothetical protein